MHRRQRCNQIHTKMGNGRPGLVFSSRATLPLPVINSWWVRKVVPRRHDMNTTKMPLAYANELNATAKKRVSKGRNFFVYVTCIMYTHVHLYICKEGKKWVSIAAILRLLSPSIHATQCEFRTIANQMFPNQSIDQ
jgi:hypothetical protein